MTQSPTLNSTPPHCTSLVVRGFCSYLMLYQLATGTPTLTPRDRTRTSSHIPGAPLSPAHTHHASVTENKFLQLAGSCAQASRTLRCQGWDAGHCRALPLATPLAQAASHSKAPKLSGREKDVVPAASHSQSCPASYPACWLRPHPTPTPSSAA